MTQTYDPKLVTLILDGDVVTGFANDGVLTIAHNNDKMTPHEGVLGDVAYSMHATNSATLTFNLMSTSSSLPRLRSKASKGRRFTVTLSDANENGQHFSGDNCVISRVPDYNRRQEVQSIAVSVYIPNLVYPEAV